MNEITVLRRNRVEEEGKKNTEGAQTRILEETD